MGLKSGSRDAGLDGSDDGDGNGGTTGGSGSERDADEGSTGTVETDPVSTDQELTEEESRNVPDTRGDDSGPGRERSAAVSTSDAEAERSTESASGQPSGSAPGQSTGSTSESATGGSQGGGGTERPPMDSIPYKLRRNKVNEGREQVPYFLRREIVDAEDDLQDALEERLGEDVYKSDYREASMVVAQRNPDLVAAVLREWGYDLDES